MFIHHIFAAVTVFLLAFSNSGVSFFSSLGIEMVHTSMKVYLQSVAVSVWSLMVIWLCQFMFNMH